MIANDYDIILLNETWLKDINNIHIPNFTILRKDRTSSEHGGLAILIKQNIAFLEEKNIFHQENYLETLGISIPICSQSNTQEKLLIISIYRPPHNTTSHANWNKLLGHTNNFKYAFFGGDFNSHHTAWGSHKICKSGENLLDSITEHNLIFLNDGTHTHYPDNQRQGDRLSSSPLDLTLVSTNISHLATWHLFPDRMNSDHFPIITNIQLKPSIIIPTYLTHKLCHKYVNWKLYSSYIDKFINDNLHHISNLSPEKNTIF